MSKPQKCALSFSFWDIGATALRSAAGTAGCTAWMSPTSQLAQGSARAPHEREDQDGRDVTAVPVARGGHACAQEPAHLECPVWIFSSQERRRKVSFSVQGSSHRSRPSVALQGLCGKAVGYRTIGGIVHFPLYLQLRVGSAGHNPP